MGSFANVVGADYGASSAQWYAGRYNETGSPIYAVGGLLSSLWSPETYLQTTSALSVGYSLSGWAARTGPGLILEGGKGTRLFQIRSFESGRPIFRIDKGPVPGRGNDILHYHRRPNLDLHRPYQGGW